MTVDPARTVMNMVLLTEDNTARSCHIVRLRTWKDCPVCSGAQSASGVVETNEDIQS
jgi:hypothetical protein